MMNIFKKKKYQRYDSHTDDDDDDGSDDDERNSDMVLKRLCGDMNHCPFKKILLVFDIDGTLLSEESNYSHRYKYFKGIVSLFSVLKKCGAGKFRFALWTAGNPVHLRKFISGLNKIFKDNRQPPVQWLCSLSGTDSNGNKKKDTIVKIFEKVHNVKNDLYILIDNTNRVLRKYQFDLTIDIKQFIEKKTYRGKKQCEESINVFQFVKHLITRIITYTERYEKQQPRGSNVLLNRLKQQQIRKQVSNKDDIQIVGSDREYVTFVY